MLQKYSFIAVWPQSLHFGELIGRGRCGPVGECSMSRQNLWSEWPLVLAYDGLQREAISSECQLQQVKSDLA
jgi:hypothetical protein